MLYLLDIALNIVHTLLLVFVLVGWVNPKTQKIHTTVLLLILFSWLLLGLYKGTIGYCILTDWHWDIKRALGQRDLPKSFISYLLMHITGINFPRSFVDVVSILGLGMAVVMAMYNHWKIKLSLKKVIKQPNSLLKM